MNFFGRRRYHDSTGHDHAHGPSTHGHHHHHTDQTHHERHGRGFGNFFHKDPTRVVAGYKSTLANPNSTRQGRNHAKHELHQMGHSAHVPLMTKIKRTLGIRSSPRRHVTHADRYQS